MRDIPPPPRWLLMALAAATFATAVFYNHAYGRVPNGPLPGGYVGRPPTSHKWPGKCWCRYHGPRGGCMNWSCPGKR